MNFFKNQLSHINRINIFILKKLYSSKVKFKVKWYDNNSIKNNLIFTPLQIFILIFSSFKIENIVLIFILLNYLFLSSLYMIILLQFIPFKNHDFDGLKENKIVYIKTKKLSDEQLKKYYEELNCYNCSIFENGNSFDNLEDEFFNVVKNKIEYIVHNNIKIFFSELKGDGLIKNSFAYKALEKKNAGGNSLISESWSIHIFSELSKVTDCIYEMDIEYFYDYKMVDFIIEYTNCRIGVSVTRAINYFNFTDKEAINLLEKKLNGLIIARNTVVEKHSFYQSILHIFSPSIETTEILKNVILKNMIDFEKFDIVGTLNIWITTTDKNEIFSN